MPEHNAATVGGTPLGLEEIYGLIPHRPPALLVDRAFILGQAVPPAIQAFYRVRPENCDGHFPGYPIMPWHIWVEASFQAGGILVAHISGRPLDGMAYEVREAKFRRPAQPGEELELVVTVLERKRASALFQANGMLDGHLSFTGILNTVLGLHVPKPLRTNP